MLLHPSGNLTRRDGRAVALLVEAPHVHPSRQLVERQRSPFLCENLRYGGVVVSLRQPRGIRCVVAQEHRDLTGSAGLVAHGLEHRSHLRRVDRKRGFMVRHMSDPAFVAELRSSLRYPHVAPITVVIDSLRTPRGGC